jgi:hypothetical protein
VSAASRFVSTLAFELLSTQTSVETILDAAGRVPAPHYGLPLSHTKIVKSANFKRALICAIRLCMSRFS